jgi:hypothetical protein
MSERSFELHGRAPSSDTVALVLLAHRAEITPNHHSRRNSFAVIICFDPTKGEEGDFFRVASLQIYSIVTFRYTT